MISQIQLVGAVMKELERQDVRGLCTRHFNAVIAAVDDMIEQIERPAVPSSPGMGLRAWLASDDTGLSSRYMASVLGDFDAEYAHPHDADDFGRCHRLLIAVPEFREKLEMMRGKSEQWAALIDCWGAIADRIKAEDYKTANKYVREAVSLKVKKDA